MKTLIIIGLLAAPAFADTVNVDPTMDQADIQTAIDNAAEGDTIKFAKGTYLLEGALGVTMQGGITLKGSKAVLDAQGMDYALIVRQHDVTVTGFRIVNGAPDGIFVGSPATEGSTLLMDGVVLTKNRIDGCDGNGISAFGTNMTIEKNRCGGNLANGIFFSDIVVEPEGPPPEPSITSISGNQCVGNGADDDSDDEDGIRVDVENEHMIIEKNLCTGNVDDGIDVEMDAGIPAEGEKKPEPDPSLIARNKCNGNGDDGINANVQSALPCILKIEKNTAHMNLQDGIDVEGDDVVITGNKCDLNNQEGMDLNITNSEVSKNKVQNNRRDGIEVNGISPEEGIPGADFGGNTIEKNTVKGNGRDGIEITCSDNEILGNKSTKNFGDGIDIQPTETEGGSNPNNNVDGNTCSGNNHEGIDNGGNETKINGNKAKDNAFGEGPDIAGTGDGAVGNVAKGEFNDNSFETGGEGVEAERDLPDN